MRSEAGCAKPRLPSLESLPSFSTACGSKALNSNGHQRRLLISLHSRTTEFPPTSGRQRPCRDAGVGAIALGLAILERAKRASHIDPPASPYAIMRRASPYRGENPGPGKDGLGELDPTHGIRERPRSVADIEGAIENCARQPNGGLILPTDSLHRKLIADSANRFRLPAISGVSDNFLPELRTECCCQPVASMIVAIVEPCGQLSGHFRARAFISPAGPVLTAGNLWASCSQGRAPSPAGRGPARRIPSAG